MTVQKQCSITVRGKRCKGTPTRSRPVFGKVRMCVYHARQFDAKLKRGLR
jgi:hypothetical protein